MKSVFDRLSGFWQFIAFTGFLFAGCSCGQEISLYDGNGLDHWTIKAVPEDQGKTYWQAKEGYIEANSLGDPDHDYVWLYSREEYEDFEISFEFQAFQESPGNSGIQIRSRYVEEDHWLNGPQIDIHPTGVWRTGMMWDETKGNQWWIFPDLPDGTWVDSTMALNYPEMYFSDDQPAWNRMRVRAEGMHIQAWLNDAMITDFHGGGILDDSLHQALEVGQKGHIAFQIHTGDELKIRYRDIMLRTL